MRENLKQTIFCVSCLICWLLDSTCQYFLVIYKKSHLSFITIYIIAAFAPMHGGSLPDSHDSNRWNQPLDTDRYFSQTERR